jgi:hypothetical protein
MYNAHFNQKTWKSQYCRDNLNLDIIHNNDPCWRIHVVISAKLEVKFLNRRKVLRINVIIIQIKFLLIIQINQSQFFGEILSHKKKIHLIIAFSLKLIVNYANHRFWKKGDRFIHIDLTLKEVWIKHSLWLKILV